MKGRMILYRNAVSRLSLMEGWLITPWPVNNSPPIIRRCWIGRRGRLPSAITQATLPLGTSCIRSAYWVEGGLIGGPVALALVLVAVGMLSGARRLRTVPELPPLPTFTQRPG